MRTDAAEIYQAYLAELISYREWFDAVVAKYGGARNPMAEWGNHDYEAVMRRNAQLKFGEQLLGLTDDEKKVADHVAGIQHYTHWGCLDTCCSADQKHG